MKNVLSNRLYGIKVLCLVTIILAHTPYDSIDSNFWSKLLSNVSRCGVPIFFIISGYFFDNTKKDIKKFWQSKVATLLIPWIIAGTLNYLKTSLNSGTFEMYRMIRFILGIKSYLYYLSMLCIFYLFFWKFRKNNSILYATSFATIIMKYLISFDLVPEIFSKNINILRWIGFFSIGIVLNKNSIVDSMFTIIEKHRIISLLISIAGISFSLCFEWSWLIGELSWIILMFNIVIVHNLRLEKCMSTIGKTTFPIYLYHQFLTTRIFTSDYQLSSIICAIARPILIVLIMFVIFYVGDYFTKKISKKLNNVYKHITGIRL